MVSGGGTRLLSCSSSCSAGTRLLIWICTTSNRTLSRFLPMPSAQVSDVEMCLLLLAYLAHLPISPALLLATQVAGVVRPLRHHHDVRLAAAARYA